jgi:hypothetical protein
MLREEEIRQALHAARVVDLHHLPMQGPVEMQHLAAVVAGITQGTAAEQPQTSLSISLPAPAVHKLEELARMEGQRRSQSLTAADIASAIVERFLETGKT